MDPAFRVALETSRSFEAEAAGAKFRLRVPTEHAWRVALERNRDPNGRVLESSAMREVLNTALTGWDGVTQGYLMPGGGDGPLVFSAEARAILLDSRQDIADELGLQLATRVFKRRDEIEAARKN